jgi:large conductance mechanosensitive channel
MGLLQEFKEFAMRGNVVDLAVGVVIGGAFGKIVNSLVTDLLMPPIGLAMGGVNFTDLKLKLSSPLAVVPGVTAPDPVTLNYGNFIQTTVDFLIVAAAIFAIVKIMNSLKKTEPVAEAAPAAVPDDVKLLTEIRDLLQNRG